MGTPDAISSGAVGQCESDGTHATAPVSASRHDRKCSGGVMLLSTVTVRLRQASPSSGILESNVRPSSSLRRNTAHSHVDAVGPHGAASCRVIAVDEKAGGGAGGMSSGIENAGGAMFVCSSVCSLGRIDSTPSPTHTAGVVLTSTAGSNVTSHGGAGGSGTNVVMPVGESRIPSHVSSVSDGP